MERKTFKTTINASPQQVWEILWGTETYPQWTAAFAEGSRAKTDWQEGSKVHFLNKDNEGMVAEILAKKEFSFMSFKHLGMVDKNGKEDTESEQVKQWAGSMENYTLTENNGKTDLVIEMDIADPYKDYFMKTWPIVLENLRKLSEKQ